MLRQTVQRKCPGGHVVCDPTSCGTAPRASLLRRSGCYAVTEVQRISTFQKPLQRKGYLKLNLSLICTKTCLTAQSIDKCRKNQVGMTFFEPNNYKKLVSLALHYTKTQGNYLVGIYFPRRKTLSFTQVLKQLI